MSQDIAPIRTPQAPATYELIPPGTSSSPVGLAATCPHCDWTIVSPYPRGERLGSSRADGMADELAKKCAEHERDHLAAYIFGALRTAVGPYGDVNAALQRLSDYGLVIVADPDWTPESQAVPVPADTDDNAA